MRPRVGIPGPEERALLVGRREGVCWIFFGMFLLAFNRFFLGIVYIFRVGDGFDFWQFGEKPSIWGDGFGGFLAFLGDVSVERHSIDFWGGVGDGLGLGVGRFLGLLDLVKSLQ